MIIWVCMNYIYFDNSSSTGVDPRVVNIMLPYFSQLYANPSGIHAFSRHVRSGINKAREKVADFINASPNEIIFTSSGTEADNFAILRGVLLGGQDKRHVIVSSIEHKAVLESAKQLEREGFNVTYLPVNPGGVISVSELERVLRHDTVLVSIMLANNETGAVQPVRQAAEAARAYGALVHTDAVHAAGKLRLDVDELGVDFLSLSSHKLYGSKGTGALFVREELLHKLGAFMYGGSQEHLLRAGTENVPGIIGFAEACEILAGIFDEETGIIGELRDAFESALLRNIPDIVINSGDVQRGVAVSSVSFLGVDAEKILAYIPELCASTGSACNNRGKYGSHVLRAMGIGHDEIMSTLRFSFGRYNNMQEIDAAVSALSDAVRMLRGRG